MLTLICTEFDAQGFEGLFACGFASPKTLELLKIHVWDTGDLNVRTYMYINPCCIQKDPSKFV